jgi:hypothetical protein
MANIECLTLIGLYANAVTIAVALTLRVLKRHSDCQKHAANGSYQTKTIRAAKHIVYYISGRFV